MTKFKFISCAILTTLSINGCSKILEPVSFYGAGRDGAAASAQEEFTINIEGLTFKTAQKANADPYPRQLMLTGSGSGANVFSESDFLNFNIPPVIKNAGYLLGFGDEVSFLQLNEFMNEVAQWPASSLKADYLLGVGDVLKFVQLNEAVDKVDVSFDDDGLIRPNTKNEDTLLETRGLIGTDGNVLLFGVGNVGAANRTLNDVRTEVRNIMIINGLAPNFQLEISNFLSKKAYVNTKNEPSRVVPINNLPVTLKEIALNDRVTRSSKSSSIIKLTRDGQTFSISAEQLFDRNAPEVFIQDKDQIEIDIVPNASTKTLSVVGSRGYILLPGVGSINAINRTLDDLHTNISNILIKKGLVLSFQLELTKFKSKKAYFIEKNKSSVIIPITNSKITLKELIISSKKGTSADGLSLITLQRNEEVFRMTWNQIFDPRTPDIWIQDQDQVEFESLTYKPGQVFALSGSGNAKMVPIDPSNRETLADILFTSGGALSNVLAKRSEIYLLRGQNPSVAYHLDAQNVSRILVAAKTELRPNDIIFVADRPIISFSRILSELSPLQMLIKDVRDNTLF